MQAHQEDRLHGEEYYGEGSSIPVAHHGESNFEKCFEHAMAEANKNGLCYLMLKLVPEKLGRVGSGTVEPTQATYKVNVLRLKRLKR